MIMALFFVMVLPWWEKVNEREFDSTIVMVGILLFCLCAFLSVSVYRLQNSTYNRKRNFSLLAGLICGFLAGIAGWVAGIMFGIPLLIAVFGMPELWKPRTGE